MTVKALTSKPIEPGPDDDPNDPNIRIPELVSVSLRPDDPFAKRIIATPVITDDLLLKITVPKRTGRKRKRGSSGPFLPEGEHESTRNDGETRITLHEQVDGLLVFRTLQDNASNYTVTPVGLVDESHRFRSK